MSEINVGKAGTKFGAIIEKGPSCWQIVQQRGGVANIELAGRWYSKMDRPMRFPITWPSSGTVYARVVQEDTGYPVVNWTRFETLPDGTWSGALQVPAGGLYRIETCFYQDGGEAIEWSYRGDMVHHVGVGDLYVIAGQSNAVGYGKDPAFDPPELGVHLLRNNGKWDLATHPLGDSTDTVHPENMDMGNTGNSPYITFAKRLKSRLGYPVGLVQAAMGGNPLDGWNPEEDGFLYRNMLSIIQSAGGRIRGVLWYHGCSDTWTGQTADTYPQRFAAFVRHLREDLKYPGLPVLTVQLNRTVRTKMWGNDVIWGKLREAQRQAARVIPGVYVIPANDSKLGDEIHNSASANIVLGERLAQAAYDTVYCGKSCAAPDIKKATGNGDKQVTLEFENISDGGRLFIFDAKIEEIPFTVEDEDGVNPIEKFALPSGSKVELTLLRPLAGKAQVHGAYGQNPACVIPRDSNTHMPMLSFYGVAIERDSRA